MALNAHEQTDLEVTNLQQNGTQAELRQAMLSDTTPSPMSSSSSPENPMPLDLGAEASSEQSKIQTPIGQEKGILTRLKSIAFREQDPNITYNTKVPSDIRACKSPIMLKRIR